NTTPLSSPGQWGRLLLAPALLLILSVILELAIVPSTQWVTKAIGSNSVNCMTIIPTLGSIPLILLIRALRRGAPSNPGLSGALAGLAASGIATTF
ncbi:NrsF family protein, partial [Acinetobacter baumannii]